MPRTEGDGIGDQLPTMQDEGVAWRQRGQDPRAEPQLLAELQGRRLLGEHRLGPRFDREAVDVIRADQPAQASGRFEQGERHAAAIELVRGR